MAKRATFAAYGLIFFAMLTRIVQYVHNRSFWRDEASLALNLRNRDFGGLFQPLDLGQGAPVPFLLVSKLMSSIFGDGEFVLRFLPLVAGILSILLLWRLCQQVAPKATLITLLFFATSSLYIYYSSEFKQYTCDAAIALGLLLMGVSLLKKPSSRQMLLAAIIGAIAVWLSHPALFVLAGIGLVVLIHAWFNDRAQVKFVMVTGAAWVMSFAVAYLLLYRHLNASSYLETFWTGYFFPLTPTGFANAYFEVMVNLSGFWNIGLLVLVMIAFILGLRKVPRVYSALLLAPLLFTYLAAALSLYPFGGRLILFGLPGALIITSAGVRDMLDMARHIHRIFGFAATGLLVLALLTRADYIQDKAEIRAAFTHLMQTEPDAKIYIEPLEGRTATYYRYPHEDLSALQSIDGPIWVIADKGLNPDFYAHLETIAQQTDEYHLPGVNAYRYVPLTRP